MARSDGVLYTGATSATAGFSSPKSEELKEKKAAEQQARLETTHRLKPAAEPVLELIAKHKAKVLAITEFAVETMVTEDHFMAEVMARKKFYQFLLTFEQEIKIALKEVA